MEDAYLEVMRSILEMGHDRMTRTGEKARSLFNVNMVVDASDPDRFPLLTTKRMAWRSILGELLAFIKGADSAEQFRELGCNVWDANANDFGPPDAPNPWLRSPFRKGTDDLGRIYGVQWRRWRAFRTVEGAPNDYVEEDMRLRGYRVYCVGVGAAGNDITIYYKEIDQLGSLIHKLRNSPFDRRMIVSAWNPGDLDEMALPPCHMMFQCFVDAGNTLHMHMVQRSCDWFLGVPFNIASYALLLRMLAQVSGRKPGQVHFSFNDAHLYHPHFSAAEEQLSRQPRDLPSLKMHKGVTDIDVFRPSHFALENYNPHEPIKAKMMV